MKAFLDTGFLLTLLTHRRGAEAGWKILREIKEPVWVTLFQLFLIRHGLTKTLADESAAAPLKAICTTATKLLNWLTDQEVVVVAELDYSQVFGVADNWSTKLSASIPALLLVWPASAAVSGADTFLSFDPRTRALAEASGMSVLPEAL